MIVVPFIKEHLDGFEPHEYHPDMTNQMQDALSSAVVSQLAWTGIVDGKVMIIAGIQPITNSRDYAWSMLSKDSGKHMLSIVRELKEFLNSYSAPRLEMLVLHRFEQGHKMAKMLGFHNETPSGMINYSDDGETYSLYAKVRHG
jgi:hypothetical protein